MAVGLRNVSHTHTGVASGGSALGFRISGRACQNAGGVQVAPAGDLVASNCSSEGVTKEEFGGQDANMEKESPDERREGREVTEVQKLVGRWCAELLEDVQAAALEVDL